MYGLRTKWPDTEHYFRTPEQRDEKREAIELRWGKSVNIEPRNK